MRFRTLSALPIHMIAAAAALAYAGLVSQSDYVTTGLQFVTPLILIMGVHFGWLALRGRLARGFSQLIFRRSAQSAAGMAVVILLASIFGPQPAQAQSAGDIAAGVFTVVFCVAIIAVIAGVIGLIIYILAKGVSGVAKAIGGKDNNDHDSRLFDVASFGMAVTALSLLSFEGVTDTFTFNQSNRAEVSYIVDRSPDQVWDTLQTATSPDFPLPNALNLFPRPIGVVTDEGTSLGAMRRVQFEGREGEGFLTFKVVESTDTTAVFEVQSDTSPIANWVAHKHLTYRVDPAGQGSRLTVTLDYDRLLAPSWFFTPLTKGAAHLAMDVLARDVKTRAEGVH